ncbi:MAG TPA: A/G-specific adenine glycosylase [Candidatus Saccharimonadales bacterium]|jgi:A/G-specific adenine glycosylase|nr:A/G-specific adenine glycosylase [Candidatus Saccharimonadales bacterium]
MPCLPLLDRRASSSFRLKLLSWYDHFQRKLPWRGETDPYRILVSEIMLQQTRVAVVEARYHAFLKQFPTVQRLARAREGSVLAAWSGLGYYRRARSLHAAAKAAVRNGGFPATASALSELPGIGRYTAAAVASIAFGEPVAVVDGNVKRVLDRLTGRKLSEADYWETAQALLEQHSPGDFNQAMMELGAMICLAGQPRCRECPVFELCVSRGPTAKKAEKPRQKATLNYLLFTEDSKVFLQQRPLDSSLMPGMWELPLAGSFAKSRKPLLGLKHSITVTDYQVNVFSAGKRVPCAGRWVPVKSAGRLPLTGLARKILKKIDGSQ